MKKDRMTTENNVDSARLSLLTKYATSNSYRNRCAIGVELTILLCSSNLTEGREDTNTRKSSRPPLSEIRNVSSKGNEIELSEELIRINDSKKMAIIKDLTLEHEY